MIQPFVKLLYFSVPHFCHFDLLRSTHCWHYFSWKFFLYWGLNCKLLFNVITYVSVELLLRCDSGLSCLSFHKMQLTSLFACFVLTVMKVTLRHGGWMLWMVKLTLCGSSLQSKVAYVLLTHFLIYSMLIRYITFDPLQIMDIFILQGA